MTIAENYHQILQNVRKCAIDAGRDPESVKLIAVSKRHPIESVREAVEAGALELGESRIQEATDKVRFFPEPVNWHFIGTLQKNKIKYIIDVFHLIHSVDSFELAEALDKHARRNNTVFNILMQVNISREEAKHGFTVENAIEAAKQISEIPHVNLHGIMGMAPYFEDVEGTRPYFQELKSISDKINQAGIIAPEISMGMSGDYEIAIQEGSTMVRVGTAIFGQRAY